MITVLLIDIGLIRGLAGCVYVNNWNSLRTFVVQISSVYAPRRDDVDFQPIYRFQKIEKPRILVLKNHCFQTKKQ